MTQRNDEDILQIRKILTSAHIYGAEGLQTVKMIRLRQSENTANCNCKRERD